MKHMLKTTLLASITSLPLPVFCQTDVFKTEFDFSSGAPLIGTDAANLNGADGQIGTFSGTLPSGDGGDGGTELVTIASTTGTTVAVDTYLLADRGVEDFTISANLSDTVELLDTTISFDIATRRTDGQHRKDHQIVGYSASGDEVFHLWISAKSTGDDGVRLGYEGMTTDGIVWDLPTTAGDDATGDINFFAGDTDAATSTLPSNISLTLSADGFVINFAGGAFGGSAGILNLYTTELLSFNGAGTDLARIEFQGEGGNSNANRGGFWLDDILVSGTLAPASPDDIQIVDCDFDPVSRDNIITFTSTIGESYLPFTSEDLAIWLPLDTVTADSVETQFIDSNIPEGVTKRFYRFSVEP